MSLKHLEEKYNKNLKKKTNRELTTFLLTRKVEGLKKANKKLIESNIKRKKQARIDEQFKSILKRKNPALHKEIVMELENGKTISNNTENK